MSLLSDADIPYLELTSGTDSTWNTASGRGSGLSRSNSRNMPSGGFPQLLREFVVTYPSLGKYFYVELAMREIIRPVVGVPHPFKTDRVIFLANGNEFD